MAPFAELVVCISLYLFASERPYEPHFFIRESLTSPWSNPQKSSPNWAFIDLT